jgi:hypothetical protein
MKKAFLLFIIFISSFGCGGGVESVDVRISLPAAFVAQDSIDRIVVRIDGEPIKDPVVQVIRPPFGASISFDITLPVGNGYSVEAFAPFVGGDNRLLYGQQFFSVPKSPELETTTFNLPLLPMNFTNFAEDANGAGDVVDTSLSQPDIASFHIYRSAEAEPLCPSSVVMEVRFGAGFVPPSDSGNASLKTLIEFDTDANSDTGSAVSRIESARGSLSNMFARGTEALVVSTNRSRRLGISDGIQNSPRFFDFAGVYDVSGIEDIVNPSINPTTVLQPQTNILFVCIPSTSFDSLIDGDGVGRVNVLSGIETSGDVATPFSGNDILFRSGSVRYDLNLNADDIPGALAAGS